MKPVPLVAKDKEKLMVHCVDASVWKLAFLYLVGRNISGDTR